MIHCCSHLTWENVVLLKIHLKGSSASKISHMHINNTHFVVPRVVFNEASWNIPATFSSPPSSCRGSPSVGSVAWAPKREMKGERWVILFARNREERKLHRTKWVHLLGRPKLWEEFQHGEMATHVSQRVSKCNSCESRTREGKPEMDVEIFAGGSLLEDAWEFLEPRDHCFFSVLSAIFPLSYRA